MADFVSWHSFRLALADIVTLTRRAFVNFAVHECAQRSGALAYYAIFSLFPLLLLTISALGFLLDAGVPLAMDAQTAVIQIIQQTLPQAQNLVEEIILTTRRARGGTGLLGLIILAWSASNIFTHARLSLNAIWNAGLPQGLGGVLRLRLNSLAMVIGTGLLLFISTIANASLDLIGRYVTRLPWSDTLWPLALSLLLSSTTVLLFAVLYRFLPRAPLGWIDVWPGAIVGGVGWEVLKQVFVWYAASVANWRAIYGPIQGVIALLLWLYLSAQVFLFGAEFAAAYSRLQEEKHAARLAESENQPSLSPVIESPSEETQAPSTSPSRPEQKPSLARGTVVGLIGAGVASGLALVGLLATGRRFLSRHEASESDETTP